MAQRNGSRIIGAMALASIAVVGLAKVAGLRVNLTASVPCGLWQEGLVTLARDNYALLCPPKHLFIKQLVDRGLLPPGYCDNGEAPFIKRMAALPGDNVMIGAHGVVVNGARLPDSEPARLDLGIDYVGTLDDDEIVFVNPMPSSIDSRYLGPITTDRLIAGVTPLWASQAYCR